MNKRRTIKTKFTKKERMGKFKKNGHRFIAAATAASVTLLMTSCANTEEDIYSSSIVRSDPELYFSSETTIKEPDIITDITTESEALPSLPDIPPEKEETEEPDITDEKEEPVMPDITDDEDEEEPSEENPPEEIPPEEIPDEEEDIKEYIDERVHYIYTEYDTEYIEDPDMYEDEQRVVNEGCTGTILVISYTQYIGGNIYSEWETEEEISVPENRVIIIGTRPCITTKEESSTEIVEKYSTIYEECDTMEEGTTMVKTAGRDAVASRVYLLTYNKGKLVSKELKSEKISERVD
ncbi:MAG: G5 domain-containing protein, partial [Eubacteriales bacterium]